jgi:serine/threonine-protein kinase
VAISEDPTIAAENGPVAHATAPTLTIGEVFADRYEIKALLGRGGMGSVYSAVDREVGETIALKLLAPGTANAEALERFRREVRLARRVTHRNAARTYDLGEHQGRRYLTMEFVEGTSLRPLIDNAAPMAVERAATIASQILIGLSAAHQAGVVHRDLKPANVLIENTGRVVLTDFGIARAAEGKENTFNTVGMIGTPAYMSPEQIRGEATDGRADIYALGLILYEMLTGILPFEADTLIATAVRRLQEDPDDPRAHGDVPDELAELIMRCLARDPEGRPSEEDILAELSEYADGSSASESMMAAAISKMTETGQLRATTSGTDMARFAPTSPGDRALAILPFRFRGPESDSFLGEALTDELVDLLSMTRGLRVIGAGATRKYTGERDPRTIGGELQVDAVVDGTVQKIGPQVRIVARLLEVESGFQLWNERFSGEMEDLFELQELMSKRIAEALRVELESIAHRGTASAEAIELYFRARRQARSLEFDGPRLALPLFEECLLLAPEFKPAIAAHAMACLRGWFVPGADPSRDWQADCSAAVANALARAPDVAETHLAAAVFHLQTGAYPEAVAALRRALKIAPTYAEVHEYLGTIECEAGRAEEGKRRLVLAAQLDPSLTVCWLQLARHHALEGNVEKSEEAFAEMRARAHAVETPMTLVGIRIASWTGDKERIARLLDGYPDRDNPMRAFLVQYANVLLGNFEEETLAPMFEKIANLAINPRFRTMILQFAAESMAVLGRRDQSVHYLREAADETLIDLEWIERCPAFDSLRDDPDFQASHSIVKRRAERIWHG